jgi:hypothetical protein
MKSFNNSIATAKTIFMQLACTLSVLFIGSAALYAKDGDRSKTVAPAEVQAKAGHIHYTLQLGNDIITKDITLSDDSYAYAGSESDIAIADPNEKFYIGVVKTGLFTQSEQCIQKNTAERPTAYTLASYLVYNAVDKTMQAIPFDNGFVSIDTVSASYYRLSFTYMLREKGTGRLITLNGVAELGDQQVVLH